MKPIPQSVTAALEQEWRGTGGYSAWDSVFLGNGDGTRDESPDRQERRARPANYYARDGADDNALYMTSFKTGELKKLIDDGVFGSMAHVNEKGTVVVNEHALHALKDFCSEVYDAWAKYQTRLAETEATYRGPVFSGLEAAL